MATDLMYLRDAELREFDATVTAIEGDRVALDRTAFYATGGGQPYDTGTLGGASVTDVEKVGDTVWHTLDDAVWHTLDDAVWHTLEGARPGVGDTVHGTIDWTRRHALMRTHTALHILCGVMWHGYGVVVTGGNMEPLAGRLDFEFPEVPEGFRVLLEASLRAEVAADRSIEVSFVPRSEAVLDDSLIRTKVSLVPESVEEIRVVDIVGLDRQADGGTHVRSTGEVGTISVAKIQSKGKGFRRIRLELA